MADISRVADQSPYVLPQVKASLRECTRKLEEECAKSQRLTELAYRAADDASSVLRSRMHFFDALDRRIRQLSELRASFVQSRRAFQQRPANLLTGQIQNGK